MKYTSVQGPIGMKGDNGTVGEPGYDGRSGVPGEKAC